jgi:hypothetical protein
MKLRLTAMLLALPALVAGLLVFSPAEAVTHYTYVSTKYVTMTPVTPGQSVGKVSTYCNSSKSCRFSLYFAGSVDRKKSYTLKPHQRANLAVYMNRSSAADPAVNGTVRGNNGRAMYKAVSGVRLYVNEDSPKNVTVSYGVTTETKSAGGIYYDIKNVSNAGLTQMHLEFHKVLRGGNTQIVSRRDVFTTKTGRFGASLGANNASGTIYRVRLTAVDDDNQFHSWWWRGSTGNTAGGGRYLRESSAVRSTKGGFDVPIYFGTIHGSGAVPGTSVKALAPPAAISGSARVRREMDVPSCANILGETVASGSGAYSIPFLPYNDNADSRYMINARYGSNSASVWLGKNEKPSFGSCQSISNYQFSRVNLIALTGSYTRNIESPPAFESTIVQAHYRGFKPTTADRHVRVREQVPGLAVLDSPIVDEGRTDSANRETVTLRPGRYWVEIGRPTSCSAWYPSRYPNNSAYLNGADRGSEAWKTVAGKYPEYQKSYDMGYVAKTPPSGYAGWMYRGYCKAYGEGTINSLTVTATSPSIRDLSYDDKGAIVKGHVTRSGGRTNKEMMVTLSSTDGKRVLRTDYTDGSGNFYVAGLASGNWKITVNADSWRGIGRTFTGKHYIRVYAGHTYGAGTLRFSG